MKKLIFILMVGVCFTQTYEDVVILKNGSEIYGIIIEEKPYEYIKIQSGKNIFIFKFDEIESLKKELLEEEKSLSITNQSLAVGFGTNRSLALLGLSRDFRLGNHFSFFTTVGIGMAVPGIGFSYQNNYNDTGFNIASTIGVQWKEDFDEPYDNLSPYLTINYQWKLNNNNFLSIGIMAGSYSENNSTYKWFDDIETQQYILPTISYDFRYN